MAQMLVACVWFMGPLGIGWVVLVPEVFSSESCGMEDIPLGNILQICSQIGDPPHPPETSGR